MHIRADDSTAMTSVFDMVAFGIHFVLGRLKSKSLAFVVSDVVGILIGFATLNLAQDLMILRFGTVKKTVIEKAYGIARHIPAVKALLVKEQTKMEESFEKDLKMKSREIGTKYGGDGPSSYSTLPAKVHYQMQLLLDLLTILSVSIDVMLFDEEDSGSMIRSFSTPFLGYDYSATHFLTVLFVLHSFLLSETTLKSSSEEISHAAAHILFVANNVSLIFISLHETE